MTVETIETDFRLKVGQSVRLVSEGVNRYRVFTPFLFEDGDHLAVVLKREDGRWVLSDEGHTYTHLTYDIDEKDLQKGNRQKIISNALSMFSVENREGELRLLIPDEQYGDGLFNFIQALLKISDVSYLSRDRVKSIFLEEFRGVTEAAVPVDRRSFDWHDPQHDPAGDTGAFWVKSGADKRPVISREEVQRMLQSADLGHADRVPVEGSTVADVDLDHFRTFFEKHYGEPLEDGAAPLTRLLENLNLAKASTLNLAGALLFARNPQRYRPAFVVKAVCFVGNDPAGERYRDSEDIGGCLRELHARTMSFLLRNLHRIQAGQGFNTEGELEVSRAALEELVVNMLLHRDYFISAPWRVMIFDDRIELVSPGALPNNLTVEHIRNGVSNMRNPLIASFATKELPYRGIGTGIRRALAGIPELGLESDHDRNLFTARIPRIPAS